jgi:hypothetical protein
MKNLSSVLGMLVKAIASGSKDNPATKLYWWLAGKKTWISLGMYAVWLLIAGVAVPFFTTCTACGDTTTLVAQLNYWSGWLADAATVLLGLGLFDAAVRLEPPKQKKR